MVYMSYHLLPSKKSIIEKQLSLELSAFSKKTLQNIVRFDTKSLYSRQMKVKVGYIYEIRKNYSIRQNI